MHTHGHTDWRMHNLIYARAIKIYTRLLEYGKYALLNDAKRQLKNPDTEAPHVELSFVFICQLRVDLN